MWKTDVVATGVRLPVQTPFTNAFYKRLLHFRATMSSRTGISCTYTGELRTSRHGSSKRERRFGTNVECLRSYMQRS